MSQNRGARQKSRDRTHKGTRHNRRPSLKWLGAGGVASSVAAGVILAIVLSAGHNVANVLTGTPQPMTVTARLSPPADFCHGGAGWVFPGPQRQLPVPSLQAGDASLQAWASAHHGIPASGNFVVADLQALPGHTVIINDVRVEVIHRAAPPRGVYPILSGGCGGIVPTSFKADLDHASIVLTRSTAGTGFGKPAPRIPLPHQVSESSPEVWYITASTTGCDCEWKAYLDWSSDGKTGSTAIDADGQPFRTAAIALATKVGRGNGSWYSY
jgi:hypothetical protein